MENRRIKDHRVNPEFEDSGLFQNAICTVDVALIPILRHNNRGDLIITGLIKNDKQIAVTFAGRRVTEAAPLVARLQALRDGQKHMAAVMKSRLPLKIEGAWRPQFVADDSGFETRTYHLIAAKWTVMDPVNGTTNFGQAPVHLQTRAVTSPQDRRLKVL